VWIADYVLATYGTGAIMAVPAHDERDWEFAKRFRLPIRHVVVAPSESAKAQLFKPSEAYTPTRENVSDGEGALIGILHTQEAYTDEGTAINSGHLNGLPTPQAKAKIIDWLEEHGHGSRRINYKLRDWLFSRQRYWGEPFPVIWRDGKHDALPESELPLIPPELEDFKPTGTGEPPLAKATSWVRYSEGATRELNTMPQWAGSCWYYLRYCAPHDTQRFTDADAEKYWMGGGKPGGVDLYVGGTEHAVLHLLYARFWHKVLFDRGYVSTTEPFQRLVNQGLILGEDGQKMSKSRGNVVNPEEVVSEYGADSLRLFEMFMGPLEQTKPWSMTGVQGVHRFLARVWRLFMVEDQEGRWTLSDVLQVVPLTSAQLRVVHATIKKVSADIEALAFNTAISQMMIFVNEFTAANPRPVSALRVLLPLLNPFAPHLTEELHEILQARFPAGSGLLARQPWPQHEERFLVESEVELPVQVNGKLRDRIVVPLDAPTAEIEAAALGSVRVQEFIAGKPVRKLIVLPGKLVNVVV
jgi:leucyl-tRNA synthetase